VFLLLLYDNRLRVHFAQESSISTSFYEKKKIKSQDSSRVVGNLSFISSLSLPYTISIQYRSDLNGNSRSLHSCALHCVHTRAAIKVCEIFNKTNIARFA